MPLDPRMLQMLASMGGPGGPGGGPPGPGGPPMGPGPSNAGPGMIPPPPPGLESLGQEGMDAMNGLVNKEPSGELSIERVRKALDMAHQLILACLPIVGTQNMDMSKQLHILGRQLADTRMNLSKENEAGVTPDAMIGGIQGTGVPRI